MGVPYCPKKENRVVRDLPRIPRLLPAGVLLPCPLGDIGESTSLAVAEALWTVTSGQVLCVARGACGRGSLLGEHDC